MLAFYASLFFSHARAEEIPPATLSVTLDTAQLSDNILQVQQEWALQKKLGIGFSEGFGFTDGMKSYQMGLLSRYYLLGGFRSGLGIGGEFSYTRLLLLNETQQINAHVITPSISLIGKYIFDFGLTIEPSIEGQFSSLQAHSPLQEGVIRTNDWDWVLGFRLGWSISAVEKPSVPIWKERRQQHAHSNSMITYP